MSRANAKQRARRSASKRPTKHRRKRQDRDAIEAEALERALTNNSEANYPAIMKGFAARGVGDVRPRENVFTYAAWKRQGRQVIRGEKGVRITTVIEVDRKTGGETIGGNPITEPVRKSRTVSVFHQCQTKLIGADDPEGHTPLPLANEPLGTGQSEPPASSSPSSSPATSSRASRSDDKAVAHRLRSMADNLDSQIEHARRPMSQNHTPKRYREYRSRMYDGACLAELQLALRALADAHERGDVPRELADLRHKGKIQSLVRPAAKEVPSGFNPYLVLAGGYADASPQAVALQNLMAEVAGEPTPEELEFAAAKNRANTVEHLEAELRGSNAEGFFPTPAGLAFQMVSIANIAPGHEVVEPSAGIGSIA